MQQRFGAFALVCASLALPATAAAASKTVYAGGPVKFQNQLGTKTGGGVDNFMVNRVTINVGDTVVWNGKARFNGFHTIDLAGTAGRPLPLFVPTGKTVTGVNDFAGSPFWFNGKVPQIGFNPSLFAASGGKTYNGTSRVDSGIPIQKKPTDFKVTFTKPGTYKYFCDVHAGMVGFVVVKPKGHKVPSAKQDAATLAKQEAAYTATAKKLDKTKVTGSNVSLGASGPGGVEVFAFFPRKLTVKSGTTVTFAMSKLTREVHTASFGPASYLGPLAKSLGVDPVPVANSVYPSDPPGTATLSPTSHGNGFASTGLLTQGSKQIPPSNTIKFTTPGTYQFMCLIHPFMHGTVVVTP